MGKKAKEHRKKVAKRYTKYAEQRRSTEKKAQEVIAKMMAKMMSEESFVKNMSESLGSGFTDLLTQSTDTQKPNDSDVKKLEDLKTTESDESKSETN